MPPSRRMDMMIVDLLFTVEEAAALSNTICGDETAAYSLQERGLLTVESVEDRNGERLAFFSLTPRGEEYVNRYFVVRTDE